LFTAEIELAGAAVGFVGGGPANDLLAVGQAGVAADDDLIPLVQAGANLDAVGCLDADRDGEEMELAVADGVDVLDGGAAWCG
jgi:hypothetical protein